MSASTDKLTTRFVLQLMQNKMHREDLVGLSALELKHRFCRRFLRDNPEGADWDFVHEAVNWEHVADSFGE